MEDFEHEEDGDLGFVEGDLLLGMELKGEWWTGKHRDGSGSGSIGHFPSSYVAKEGEEHLWVPEESEESEEESEEEEI